MNITLNGNSMVFEKGSSALDMMEALDKELKKTAIAARVNGELKELMSPIEEDGTVEILDFSAPEAKHVLRHTASHVLAEAVKNLYPDTKLAIGPAIETGFYYDFDTKEPFTADDLVKIEKEMKKIIKRNEREKRFVLARNEAIKLMEEKNEPYKVELIRDLPEDAEISFYSQGEFVDLCAGPHLPSTGKVKAFKLLSIAGAYWRGSEKNKMLQRIYGTAFFDKEELDAHLQQLEEAKKRDHNKIGRELEFFTTTEYIGQGLPIMLPKGTKTLQLLQRFVEDEEEKRGYMLTKTPLMAKRDLYKISGHWDHYRSNMFVIGDQNDETKECFALRPMTCPFQFQHFLNRTRSYRDLPMRLNETSTLFRNESSGEMHGLIRLRQFTISEGHIICTPEQVNNEFAEAVKLAKYMLATLGLDESVSYRFSLWDENNREKYIGDPESWENTQNFMRSILNDLGIDFKEAKGEAAFYGPKLDIQIKNVFGKEDTLITVQVDFQLAHRFEMQYTDKDGEKKYPIIIHRTSIGCYERTLALLLEKYAGALPMWMNPEQVRVLTITDRANEAAVSLNKKLKAAGIRSEADLRNEKIGFKVREAQMNKIPYMLVIGDREAEEGTVSVRTRLGENLGEVKHDVLVEKLVFENASRSKERNWNF